MINTGVEKTEYPFNIITKPIGPLCNLRCEYCFYLSKEEMFSHENKKDYIMSQPVLENYIKKYIQAQPRGTAEVVFGWQGGEPTLLGIDFFREVIRLQKKFNVENITVKNSIQTNGTLITDEMARFFKENEFLVGISIDGPEKLHNKYRLDRKGRGSFSMVMRGMERLRKYEVDFNTLTVVQNDNSRYPDEVYQFLKENGSDYIQFIPIVEPVNSPADKNVSHRTVDAGQWGKFLTAVFQKWISDDIGKVFIQHFDLTLGRYLGQPSSICVHSKYCGKAMAIEHNGNMYSCDHFVTEDNYIGNITESLVDIVSSEKQVAFGKAKYDSLPGECLSCEYLQLCYGGCPKNRLITRPDGRLNWLCDGYKYYYEKTHPFYIAMAKAIMNRESALNFRKFFCLTPKQLKDITRNDPCPCLSGKKFKNCHGR